VLYPLDDDSTLLPANKQQKLVSPNNENNETTVNQN